MIHIMNEVRLRFTDGRIVLERDSDGEKFVKLDGHIAMQISALALHAQDLDEVYRWIQYLEDTLYDDAIRQALWYAAIVKYARCFGENAARSSRWLHAEVIFKGKPAALELHKHFINLRDNHLIHDKNYLHQCPVGAVISKRGSQEKVRHILACTATVESIHPQTIQILKNCVIEVRNYLEGTRHELMDRLKTELETKSVDDLLALPEVTYHTPEHSEIKDKRKY